MRLVSVFIYNFSVAFVMGLVSLIIGRIVSRDRIEVDKFPYKLYGWERSGRVYDKLRIGLWKDKLPDVSVYLKSVFPKRVDHRQDKKDAEYFMVFAKETCVSELVHTVLMLASPIFFLVNQDIMWGAAASIVYFVGNIPFILVQRYNRPRLLHIVKRAGEVGHITNKNIATYR